ncbi:hypothetical protein H072_346 [Dactylellina haptotyla CBS 200.50]|uniref:Uncharacterized protein n=1 Tax=Dactylellina haptotyla (strain CBS 200.50) TaxID=1284197 RepID=S8CD84_DACHA|nr:hypothetical protein H072_346 [Dactylellina haptotyla CBS 200.50]
MSENQLRLDNHLLVCVEVDVRDEDLSEYLYLKANFCGRVVIAHEEDLGKLDMSPQTRQGIVYVCGDIGLLYTKRKNVLGNIKVIKEFSANVEGREGLDVVTLGEVPINVHGAGVYYRNPLGSESNEKNYFDLLQTKHKFQALTESNKPGTAFRKGVYLSEVETDGDASQFHLLRCSTNLDGPTLGFADEDHEIVARVNELARRNFEQKTTLNHVLAQVYENTITVDDLNKVKEHKAKIKSHSDKTKDMPANGLIVFCTFYASDISFYKAPPGDRFNRYYKEASVLTQLRFKLKPEVHDLPLTKDFRVTLYPNSILLISLATNRLYTHEIVPPTLPVGKFPTRLGYVVRCSKTKAVHRGGATFIQREGKEDLKLEKATPGGIGELKRLYQQENMTAEKIEYKEFLFSLNEGDYTRPLAV